PEQRIHHVHRVADRNEHLGLRIERAYFFCRRSRIQIPGRAFTGMLSAITVENVEILVQAAEIAGKLKIPRKEMQLLFPRDEYLGVLPQIVAERTGAAFRRADEEEAWAGHQGRSLTGHEAGMAPARL